MSVSYFVRYEGRTEDAKAFVARYRRVHVPILERWPGVRRIILHTPADWRDPCPVHHGNVVLLVQMVFDSAQALDAALASAERLEAREDFARFPPFAGEVTHQAMLAEEIHSGMRPHQA